MIWRGEKKYYNNSNNAITSVISTVIILAIIIGTTTTIFSAGFTEIKNINDKTNELLVESNINYLSDSINKITSSRPSDKIFLNNLMLKGNINIDTEKLDKILIYYSLSQTYDFSVTILNDEYSELVINQINNPIVNSIKILKIDNYGKINVIETRINEQDDEYRIPLPQDLIDSTLIFQLYLEDNTLIAKIWLINSPALLFSDSNNNFDVILDSIGVLYPSSEGNEIKKQTLMNINKNYIVFRIFQINNDKPLFLNLNDFNTIYIENNGSNNFGLEKVYFLRLQIHNDYSQEWINYFSKDNLLFDYYSDGTLLYIPSTEGIWLSLLYSNIKFEYK